MFTDTVGPMIEDTFEAPLFLVQSVVQNEIPRLATKNKVESTHQDDHEHGLNWSPQHHGCEGSSYPNQLMKASSGLDSEVLQVAVHHAHLPGEILHERSPQPRQS